MHVYFSGIGGTGIGPLAIIAKQAGIEVSGSDKQMSDYIAYLKSKGIDSITIGQTIENIEKLNSKHPIDWLVYSSAVVKENPNHPELVFAKNNNIRLTKRSALINYIIEKAEQKIIAIAGTHGKSTTTAMTIWLFKQLNLPISYSVGAKLPFGDMGHFDNQSKYFIYEADEYDKNFLDFNPEISVIPGIDYDHPDTYPSKKDYTQAFIQFIEQSRQSLLWTVDTLKLDSVIQTKYITTFPENTNLSKIILPGKVNRKNAYMAIKTLQKMGLGSEEELTRHINSFPGLSRRFEKIVNNIYSDYAHTPEKIHGAIQTAHEITKNKIAVVYEGLHNTRQHFMVNELKDLFIGVEKLYIVPSYLAREDESLELLTPEKLIDITEFPKKRNPARLNDNLKKDISRLSSQGYLVLCLSAGGGGSLDEWLRANFKP